MPAQRGSGRGQADVDRPATDAALMLAAQTDPDAFVEIFDRHFDPVCRYLTRRAGPDAGEELAAETFAQAFDARDRYEPQRGDVRAWLFGIAVNLLRHHHRKETRQLRAYARSGVDPVVDHDGDAEDRLEADAMGPRVAAALAKLSASDREVLLLYAWAELGYEEIAAALDVPVGTIRSRLSRSRVRGRRAARDRRSTDPDRARSERETWMDQLDLIRGFRRQLGVQRPDAEARARRALHAHMTGAAPPARSRPRIPFPRQALSIAAVATAIGAAVAVFLLVQGVRGGRSPAQPGAVAAQPSSPERAGASLPVSSSYRDYLQFASRMTRLEVRTAAERTELPAGTSFCAQPELAAVERLAIETLTAAGVPRGRPVLDSGMAIELAEGRPCRYAGFGIERAQAVYGGLLPVSNLMPDAQSALPRLGLVGKPLL